MVQAQLIYFFTAILRRLSSFMIEAGSSLQLQAFRCATCHSTRWSSVAFFGMGCAACQSLFMLITLRLLNDSISPYYQSQPLRCFVYRESMRPD
jgi:hypothetical protein